MSRHGLHRVPALWPIAAAGLLLLLLPSVAWADNCGSIGDCFGSAGAAAAAAAGAAAVWLGDHGLGFGAQPGHFPPNWVPISGGNEIGEGQETDPDFLGGLPYPEANVPQDQRANVQR